MTIFSAVGIVFAAMVVHRDSVLFPLIMVPAMPLSQFCVLELGLLDHSTGI